MNTDRNNREPCGDRSIIAAIDAAATAINRFVVSVLLVVMILDVLWGVFTRFGLGQQASWTEELARLLLVWVSLLGGALAYSARSHLGLDLVVSRFEIGVARGAERFVAAVIYIFATGVLIVGGTTLYAERLDFGQAMPALGISRAWQYLPLPICGLLIAITATKELLEPMTHVNEHDAAASSNSSGGDR